MPQLCHTVQSWLSRRVPVYTPLVSCPLFNTTSATRGGLIRFFICPLLYLLPCASVFSFVPSHTHTVGETHTHYFLPFPFSLSSQKWASPGLGPWAPWWKSIRAQIWSISRARQRRLNDVTERWSGEQTTMRPVTWFIAQRPASIIGPAVLRCAPAPRLLLRHLRLPAQV